MNDPTRDELNVYWLLYCGALGLSLLVFAIVHHARYP
jgi:hypothetical protein